MKRIIMLIDTCPLCGEKVELVPDSILLAEPHQHNSEFVVTNSGHKQYFHTTCWDEMITNQKQK